MHESIKELKEGTDYEFLYSEKDPEATVKLLSGEYKDICVKFFDVSIKEDDGQGYLNYGIDVVESNGSLFLEDNIDFKNYLGDVLTSIIWNNMIKDKEQQ